MNRGVQLLQMAADAATPQAHVIPSHRLALDETPKLVHSRSPGEVRAAQRLNEELERSRERSLRKTTAMNFIRQYGPFSGGENSAL